MAFEDRTCNASWTLKAGMPSPLFDLGQQPDNFGKHRCRQGAWCRGWQAARDAATCRHQAWANMPIAWPEDGRHAGEEHVMPMLRPVPRSEITDEVVLAYFNHLFGDRDPTLEPGTATGTPGDWWSVFALSPDIFRHAVNGFALYRSPQRRIDPVLRELGQTRAGWVKGSQFVFSQHCKSLRGLGCSEEKIAAVPHWQVADCFDEQERAVLAYADCLSQSGGRTPKAVMDRLKTFWDDQQILEFTYITCLYDMHAVITRALRLEFDDREDPIVEVAAPEDFDAADFLGARRKQEEQKQ
jgi:alkylhydroperoxidase family enzyme